ncbi:MAG: ComF family protein [Ruminococcus sp.]|nr:ComF family protein [Ruminococcus sp.]
MNSEKQPKKDNGGKIRRFIFGDKSPHEVYRFLINFLYPNICPCCEEIIDYNDDFCDKCRNQIVLYNDEFSVVNADHFVAYCAYKGKIRNAIRIFKYEPCGNSYYAFAFGIVQALRRNQLTNGIDAVTFIPMIKSDERKRGYNQTKLMAKEIHYLLDIPCIDVLQKIRRTKKQKSMKASERFSNVDGAFDIKPCKYDIKGKCILVIDDLCTTGSTLSEASRVLKSAGAKTVIAASFAKTSND